MDFLFWRSYGRILFRARDDNSIIVGGSCSRVIVQSTWTVESADLSGTSITTPRSLGFNRINDMLSDYANTECIYSNYDESLGAIARTVNVWGKWSHAWQTIATNINETENKQRRGYIQGSNRGILSFAEITAHCRLVKKWNCLVSARKKKNGSH